MLERVATLLVVSMLCSTACRDVQAGVGRKKPAEPALAQDPAAVPVVNADNPGLRPEPLRLATIADPLPAVVPAYDAGSRDAALNVLQNNDAAENHAPVTGEVLAANMLQGTGMGQAAGDTRTNNLGYREQEGIKKAPVRLDPGEKRPSNQFQVPVFGRPLTIGGQYQIQPSYRKDNRLDPDRKDDKANLDHEFKLELLYRLSEATTIFIQGKFFYEAEVYVEDGGSQDYLRGFERQQSWIFFQNIFATPFSLQVGRQRVADKRQWWWNDELDAIRAYYNDNESVAAELGVAEQAGVKSSDEDFIEPVDDGLFRLFGDVVWQWQEKQTLSLFFLSQFDHSTTETVGARVEQRRQDQRDADLTWFGARALGKVRVSDDLKANYWFDAAGVVGREKALEFDDLDDIYSLVTDRHENDVRAWALDTGATLFTQLPLRPYFTFGYARGSGDSDPNDGLDSNYRQSGLQGNKVKLSGNQRFAWYGEALRPELSNLQIWSLGLGVPLSEDSSIDFVYHNYTQVEASKLIRNSRLRAAPDGMHRDLGEEYDLILSLDEWEQVQFQLIASFFKSGEAFGPFADQTMSTFVLKLNYSF